MEGLHITVGAEVDNNGNLQAGLREGCGADSDAAGYFVIRQQPTVREPRRASVNQGASADDPMIDLDWLRDELVAVLRWQLVNPGKEDHPDAPDVPFAGRRVWSIFLDLNTPRAGGFGPTPITYGAIETYARADQTV